jgi:type I restriction enzyme R subunit
MHWRLADNNDWLVVNQYTVIENKNNRRPDVVIFINGLPLGVIELKNTADEKATIHHAFKQFQTYKQDIPALFPYNEILVISDGTQARAGTLTADWERFMPWRTIDGRDVASKGSLELEVLIKGIFEKERFLDLIRHFSVFEIDGASIVKKLAGYHQFHAANKAVEQTLRASSMKGDRRVGVIWHTQGSGKSLTMVFYAGKIIRHAKMANPTLVFLTDRNDLDDQLFGTFALSKDLLRQTPVQAEDRDSLRDLLQVASGGVIFTTIQKFLPESKGERYPQLSDRRNIIVIADEAHRSQYDFIDGFARHMHDALPNASFVGFTGTPIEKTDRSTPAVFGDYIDIYDIQRAVEDGATVTIYYEGRLAKLELKPDERPKIDPQFEEVTEGEEVIKKEYLKSKWARLEAMVGTDKRVRLIAQDIVAHWEQRSIANVGKAMIVCMSRRICIDLYNALVALHPDWHSDADDQGILKVVMTGSASDDLDWQPHIRNKPRREALAKRFKNADDSLKIVIVRDMWLTGFDAPSLNTMYVDKPMRGHGLMQAIARVNRVFKDKPGGLVVDYLGLADELKNALADYTEADRGETGIPQEEAVAVMLEKYEVVVDMFHGFDYSEFINGTASERIAVIPLGMQHILEIQDGKSRFIQAVSELSKAFALSVPNEKALAIRDDVGFFQAVRAALLKHTTSEDGEAKTEDDLDSAIRQIVSRAVASDQVIDIFAAAGMKTPDISILSDEFLAEVRSLPQKNLALELLRKLINDELKAQSRKNLVVSRSFAEMLEKTIRQYQNRSIETAQVITQLIELAKDMRAAQRRGEDLGLTDDELAFYDALEVNDSAVKVLGDDALRTIARELVESVRRNVTIDWTLRESARAKLRTLVKRILRNHGYPPDKQEKATQTVLEQAELIAKDWAE